MDNSILKDMFPDPPPENYSSSTVRPDRNWRAEGIVGSVKTHTDKGFTDTTSADYNPGCIILIPHVVSSVDDSATMGELHVGFIPYTGPVIGKRRPAIVVAVYEHSMVCLPVRTSSGGGIPPGIRNECLWLRSWTDTGITWADMPESKYMMLRPRAEPRQWQYQRSSYVDLTRPFTVQYEYPMYRIGDLSARSWSRLNRLWLITVEKGMQPINKQTAFAQPRMREISIRDDFRDVRELELRRQSHIARQNANPGNKGGAGIPSDSKDLPSSAPSNGGKGNRSVTDSTNSAKRKSGEWTAVTPRRTTRGNKKQRLWSEL